MDFQITVFDYNTEHVRDYVVNVRGHKKYYVFLYFKTPFSAMTITGMECGNAGDFLIISPDFPLYHTNIPGSETGFVNTWCHCEGSVIAQWLTRYHIPVNQIIKIQSGTFFDDMINAVRSELLQDLPFCGESVRIQFEKSLIELSRQRTLESRLKKQHFIELRTIRNKMLQNPSAPYSVRQLAEQVHLSPSRFAHLYKSFFNASPIEELLEQRLLYAKRLLLSTNMKVEEIAMECGFYNVFHFSRQFKNKTGKTPSQYRSR